MADQNCSSPSSPAPVIITSTAEQIKPDANDSNPIVNSTESTKFVDNNRSSSDENASCTSQSSNSKLLFSDSTLTSSSENKNGVSGTNEKDASKKTSSFLRPSLLSSGFSSFSTKNVETGKADSTFSLKSSKLNPDSKNTSSFLRPSLLSSGFSSFSTKNVETGKEDSTFSLQSSKLNLASSKFGDASFTSNNASSSVNFGSDKNETSTNSLKIESQNSGNSGNSGEKSSKPTLGIFSSNLNFSTPVSITPKPSAISVPNFVFGQNLQERVTDSVKSTAVKEKPQAESQSNGTSDMLFTSVLTSNEVKDNLKNDKVSNSKDSSSLIEDAARCQEARASKRKYEEVLVTTGEEGEENILQVNVKLFAFDNGSWLERGRGILRLNDKISEENITSRIVIRTVGSLRVVLNTKIWSGMSLSRASERSARLTAIDPNGQVKIFLIQASLKDMTQLFPLIEDRIKLCKDLDSEAEESPQKKITLDKGKM